MQCSLIIHTKYWDLQLDIQQQIFILITNSSYEDLDCMIIFGRTPSPAMNSYQNLQVSVTNQYIAISYLTTHLISRLVFNTINFKPFFPGRAGPSHFYYIVFKYLRKYNKVYIHFSYITPQQSLDRRVKTEEKSGSERCL